MKRFFSYVLVSLIFALIIVSIARPGGEIGWKDVLSVFFVFLFIRTFNPSIIDELDGLEVEKQELQSQNLSLYGHLETLKKEKQELQSQIDESRDK
jgi:hypothetical protein